MLSICNRTHDIRPQDILCFVVLRNEALRLPYFLDHYRRLGVQHFIIIDNDSTDGSAALLTAQADVSLWHTHHSYKAARFGMDWQNWLLRRYGSGHWVLAVDVDELLIYPDWETRDLRALSNWLDQRGSPALSAMMLDLYPKGPLNTQRYLPGQDPLEVLNWFDAYGYWAQRQPKLDTLWLQGGARARNFFAATPERAPTLNKIPFIKWRSGYAFVNSAHSVLPSHLNHAWSNKVSGTLLHTKFLPDAAQNAHIEQARQEHFWNSALYDDYYNELGNNPNLWHQDHSYPYTGWQDLLRLGLMSGGDWTSSKRE